MNIKTFIIIFSLIFAGNVLGQKDSSLSSKTTQTVPEIPAEFPGGNAKLLKYIKTNVSDKATIIKDQPVEKVIAKFYVDSNGNVKNAAIYKTSKHENIDKLLVDAINAMPKWTPAQNPKGKNVGQEIFLPLYLCQR